MSYTLPQPASEDRILELLADIDRMDAWLQSRKAEYKSFGYTGTPRDPDFRKVYDRLMLTIDLCEDIGREFFGDEWDAPEEVKAQPFDSSFGDGILRSLYG
jgi:hypothetical protein